ncbi:DNA polymerase kappa [Phytophthora citrophthora]|uniref:DNA-directed DNA polymerase n=1 Tax=Phytophthora citrophthora TaxID=4793 RepID=A0AAD9H0G8_9STRA|nr:DNA polymerase kappa [Phytophthora citrophthora]
MNKPNGQYVLPFTREHVINFIRELPVRKIGGIGKVTEKILSEALNVHTGGDLFAMRGKISHLFSEKTATWLLQTSLGVRERREKQERKSFSRERTFGRLSDPKQLESKCREICKFLAKDLEKAGKAAKNVTFVYKDTDFARCSRSMTLASAVFTAEDLYANAVELLRRELPLTLRLMGVRAATLVSRPTNGGDSSRATATSTENKRQIEIKKFAERIMDPVAALSSNAPRKTGLSGDAESSYESDVHMGGSAVVFLRSKMQRKSVIKDVFTARCNPKSMPKVDNKPCPICGKLLNAGNNMEVNAHIDACVGSTETSSSSSPQRRKKPQKSIIPQAFSSDSTMPVNEDFKPCPICGKLLNARNNMEVNAHMDACVSGDRLPQQKLTGKKRGAREMSRKKLDNGIDVLFRKLNNT